MRVPVRLLIVVLALLIGSAARAQEPKGWLGVDVQDVTKAEADKLGWDAPRGAKLGVVAPGSPADAAGLKTGDIIVAIDRTMVDTSSDVDALIAAKRPGAEVRLQVLSGARERRVAVTLAERPKAQAVHAGAKPHLMLDTGGHMAIIRSLAFTPDGKLVVSAGDDKVIRVWDWQLGKTVRTIRGQMGPGQEGKIYTMALSPDGRWLAIGGWTHKECQPLCGEIRLYAFATGKIVGLLKGHTNVVLGLAFSSNGKQLISGGADAMAIVWDVADKRLVYRLAGHKNAVSAVGFTPDGARAVTGGRDTTLKLWSMATGKEIATLAGHKDVVRTLAISPVDGTIASGAGEDSNGEIRLWDSRTGEYLRTLANQGSWVGALSFSPNGLWLLSTCAGGPPCSREPQIVWEVASGRRILQPRHHDNVVVAGTMSADGQLAVTGGFNGDVRVWELKAGKSKQVLAGTGAPGWATGFSADGQRIAWGTKTKSEWTIHDRANLDSEIRLPGTGVGLGRPEPIGNALGASFVRALGTYRDYTLAHRKGGAYGYDAILDIKKGGQTLVSIERGSVDGFDHRAYSFTPDGQTVISGGIGGALSAYDLNGKPLGNYVGHDSDVWAVTPSPDGRLLVSGSADQTIRLWNLKTYELIVTLFHGSDGEWVMWTPQGYYTGSPGADKIVGWQINKGPENAADYVGAEQLRQHLNRPDIVERAIILASAEQAVREAPGTTFQLADLLARPVPRFRIVAPLPDSVARGGRTVIRLAIEATPDPIKSIRVQANGRQVEEQTPGTGSGGFGAGEQVLSVPLAAGRNEVRVTLTNAIGEKAETVALTHEGEGDLDRRGTLYILAIGVDKYPGLGNTCGADGNGKCDLSFSGADARALVQAVEKRLGPAHTSVVKRILVNGAEDNNSPTASNILDAIDLLKQAKETDTVLLFIAGHGFNDGSNYRFLPTNAERRGDTFRGATVVPWQILQEAVETAKGRRILFIDTCHSGNAYNQRLGNAAYHANIVAYTAARFDQEALEDSKLGHGLFTYAVVEGLEAKGGFDAKRQISTRELADYVIRRVNELAKSLQGQQEPQYFKGRDAEDYVLARW
jgi:WD40 repeat protein